MTKIITAADVTDRTGADASTAALLAESINDDIERATARVWGDTKTVTEVHDAAAVIWLGSMDITDVTSVKLGYPNETGTELTASEYTWSRKGRITLSYAPLRALPPLTNDYVAVTYTCGVATDDVPASLKLAALNLASSEYAHINSDGREISEESIGSYRLKYDGNSRQTSRDWQVIRSHAVRRV